MRPYNPNDPDDKKWNSQVYARAKEFVPEFLSGQPDSCATRQDIDSRFRQENPILCDDTIAENAKSSNPKWKHTIASSIQALKKRGDLVSPEWAMWCLSPVGKSALDAPIGDSHKVDEIPDMENQGPGNPNMSSDRDTKVVLDENLQSEMNTLKLQLASQQSAIVSLNTKIDSLSVSRLEEDTEDDVIGYLRERVLKLDPGEFERLVGEYLKSKGFSNVVVSGRPGDGGIDGECDIPFINVKVAFQAKRYADTNSIGIELVQRLQGSMTGRFDRGIFITTSDYTSAARGWVEEVQAQITLINGDELMKEMIDLGLGVKAVTVVKHEVDENFFTELENTR